MIVKLLFFSYLCFKGPLPHTAKHFWQMIWEQKTEAVIMLNRVVEKNQVSFMDDDQVEGIACLYQFNDQP